MTAAERVDRLERLVLKLASALRRKDSEQDGNWGWPSFNQEMAEILTELAPEQESTAP